jgi:hypothetical protein
MPLDSRRRGSDPVFGAPQAATPERFCNPSIYGVATLF